MLTQEDIEDALEWYESNDLNVIKVDFQTNKLGRLAFVTEEEGFNLELSEEEIEYRAELWREE